MSDDLERRFNNFQETILENQARFDREMRQIQEAIAGLIQVARIHDELIDQNSQQIKELNESLKEQRANIDALTQQGKEQDERINALIRIVEGHISNHP